MFCQLYLELQHDITWGGIGKGKLYFLLLKLVKSHEGPLGQRKVSELICRELKVEVEVIFSLAHVFILSFYLNPFTPEPPVTARADPGPFYPL